MKSSSEQSTSLANLKPQEKLVSEGDSQAFQCELKQDFAKLYKLDLIPKESFYNAFEIHKLATKYNLPVGIVRNMFSTYCCQQKIDTDKTSPGSYQKLWHRVDCWLRQKTIWVTPAKGVAIATAIGGIIAFSLPIWQLYSDYKKGLKDELEILRKEKENREKEIAAQEKSNEIAERQNIKEAWDTIFDREGKTGDGGRRAALQYLNSVRPDNQEINLSGIVLSRAELSSIELIDAHLENANFQGARLNRANLSGSSLFGADFSALGISEESDREKATKRDNDEDRTSLLQTNLYRTSLVNANLDGAILTKANLREADLLKANLKNADLEFAILIDVKNLTLEQLKSAVNWQVALYNSEWRSRVGGIWINSFSNQEFRNLNLANADLSYIDLTKSDFSRANLTNVDLTGANLNCTVFIEATGLTPAQVIKASNYWSAIYDEEFRQEFNSERQPGDLELADNREQCQP